MGPTRPFLPNRRRRCVLEMRLPDLDNVLPFSRFRLDRLGERPGLGQQMPFELKYGGDVHRSRESVVRRLPHVHVIVQVHRRLAANLAAEQLDRVVRQHFFDVHIRLRA